jgi:tetratricopeptide (TPR) repeat protein
MKRFAVAILGLPVLLVMMSDLSSACETCRKAREALFSTPPKLVEGVGHVHFPVSTLSGEAQCFFNQGVAFLYAFNHDEAARCFNEAAKLDSTLAMAHWGIAYATGPNYNLPADSGHLIIAYKEIHKAQELEKYASDRERAYIDAMSKRYAEDVAAPRGPLDSAYWAAMREIHQKYPDDLDAAVMFVEAGMNLRPWMLWNHDGTPAPGTEELVSTLEGVMQRNPAHTGANHYYIHCVEASPNPERGLAAGYRLDTLAPACGHLVHMPAHIYMRAGDYADAVRANDQGVAIDEKYLSTAPAGSMYQLMYYHHNVHFLSIAQLMEGDFTDSYKNAVKLEASLAKFIKGVPMLEGVDMTSILCLVRFDKWPEVLALPQPDPNLKSVTALWRYARATALVETGKLKDAKKEVSLYHKAVADVPPQGTIGFLNNSRSVLMITDDVLAARLAMAQGKPDSALALLRRAVKSEDALTYDEPEGWYIPVRETLGALLLKQGKYADAEQVFREELTKHRQSGRALFGLREALKGKGDTADADLVDQQFKFAWRNADTPLKLEDLL